MINLLAPEMKRQIRAARMNVLLRNYCLIFAATTIVVLGIFGTGTWLSIQQRREAEQRKAQATQAASQYGETRQATQSFVKDLQQAKSILGGEVSFYNLITSLAAVVPAGVILNNLAIDTSALKTPLTITGRATNYEAAVRLKNALSDSKLFQEVKLTSVTEVPSGQDDPLNARYPVSVTLSATFSPDFAKGIQP